MADKTDKTMAFILTGGGARSAYALGVLKYIFQEIKAKPESPIFVGSSAGAINAIYLCQNAHKGFDQAIEDLCEVWSQLTVEQIYKTDVVGITKIVGRWLYNVTAGRITHKQKIESLLDSKPLYELIRSLANSKEVHKNIDSGVIGALGITATQYGTGRSMTFYQTTPGLGGKKWFYPRREGVETKITLKHVLASAAIPVLFPAVKIGEDYYGDGSIRFTTPLSPAIHLGAEKICAIGLRKSDTSQMEPMKTYPSVAQIGSTLLNAIFHDSLDYDIHTLRKINRLIENSNAPLENYIPIDISLVQPSTDLGAVALEYEKHIPKTLRYLLNQLGSQGRGSADLLSYLLYESHYVKKLIEIGFADAASQKEELEKLFKE